MQWTEFLDKLTEARTLKKDGKLGVAVIGALIFSGAFDSMITEEMYLAHGGTVCVSLYTQMFEDVRRVKASKAKLPKKKKGEFIGLDEVDNMLKLSMWRSQLSPIVKKIDFSSLIAGNLSTFGYQTINKEGSIFKFIRGADTKNKLPQVLGTPEWRTCFASRLNLFDNGAQLMVYGVVSNVRILKYGPDKDKERLVFQVFTGYEMTDDIVMWPSRQTGELNAAYKHEIKDGQTCFVLVRPSLYNNKPTATVISFTRIGL